MLEPFVELVPAPLNRIEFGQFRWKVPDSQIIPDHARDRTVADSLVSRFPLTYSQTSLA